MKTKKNKNPNKKGALGDSFNTLAINGTASKNGHETKPEGWVMGNGTDLKNALALERRAKRKLITQTMAMCLMQVARKDQNWKWEARFSNTLLCQNQLTTANGRSYSPTCKNRCCTICLAIRKAEKINLYLRTLEAMEDPYFLTLTTQAVTKDELKKRVHDTAQAIRTIIARHKKRNQRKKEQKFYGIWSLESNFNPIGRTYNPHLHLLLPNLFQCETLLKEWMEYWNERNVSCVREAQYFRNVKPDRKQDLIEIVKYGSKIFTEPDIADRIKYAKEKKPSFIYVRALYNILLAMDDLDVFNTYGFKLPKRDKPRKRSTKLDEYIDWDYDLSAPDWINENLGLRLANYKPPADIEELLGNRINTDME